MPTTRHEEYTKDPTNGPAEGPKQFKPAVPELTIGTPTEQTTAAMPEVQATPPVPSPELIAPIQTEAPSGLQPPKEITFQPSEQAATMADQHASLVPEGPIAAPPAQHDTRTGSGAPQTEKHKGLLAWVIDKVSAKPKPKESENQLVIPGERPNAPVMPITESNPGRGAELGRLEQLAKETGKPGVIGRQDQDALDRGILTEVNQQDPQDKIAA